MLQKFFRILTETSPLLREVFWKLWYNWMAGQLQNKDWVFMNYGYSSDSIGSSSLNLLPEDKPDIYCAQLYDYILKPVNCSGLKMMEVGSGRGGGASFVCRYLKPSLMVGVDFSKKATEFCLNRYDSKNLRFVTGNASSLPFEDNSFDVVLNVESSHCYPDMNLFLSEVKRVLRPGGYFAFADLRDENEVSQLDGQLQAVSMEILIKEDITAKVVFALTLDSERKKNIIKHLVPKWLEKSFLTFAAIDGSSIYREFKSGKKKYWYYLLKKTQRGRN